MKRLGKISGIIVLLLAVALLMLTALVAFARDPGGRYAQANPELHKWFEEQTNGAGGSCCSDADGHLYDGDYTINADGSVTLEIEGEKVTMEAYKVLNGPNPTGHAVVWYLKGGYGLATYCFAAGPQI